MGLEEGGINKIKQNNFVGLRERMAALFFLLFTGKTNENAIKKCDYEDKIINFDLLPEWQKKIVCDIKESIVTDSKIIRKDEEYISRKFTNPTETELAIRFIYIFNYIDSESDSSTRFIVEFCEDKDGNKSYIYNPDSKSPTVRNIIDKQEELDGFIKKISDEEKIIKLIKEKMNLKEDLDFNDYIISSVTNSEIQKESVNDNGYILKDEIPGFMFFELINKKTEEKYKIFINQYSTKNPHISRSEPVVKVLGEYNLITGDPVIDELDDIIRNQRYQFTN